MDSIHSPFLENYNSISYDFFEKSCGRFFWPQILTVRADIILMYLQSKALIRTFKKMKDYILENRDLIGQREILQLSMETANNRIEINKINSDMLSIEK